MRKNRKKLTLDRETLTQLDRAHLVDVRGGTLAHCDILTDPRPIQIRTIIPQVQTMLADAFCH